MFHCFYFAQERLKKGWKKIKITNDVDHYLWVFFFQIVKMLVIVVAVFGVCWLPLHVFAMLVDFYEGFLLFENEQEHLRVLIMFLCVHWLAMSNSFANPIIYGFTNENFRVSFFPKINRLCIVLKQSVVFQSLLEQCFQQKYYGKFWKSFIALYPKTTQFY